MSEVKFASGFYFSRVENAPDYVVGKLSITEKEAVDFIKGNSKDGKLSLDIKKSKNGKYYLAVNTYVKKVSETTKDAFEDNDLPF